MTTPRAIDRLLLVEDCEVLARRLEVALSGCAAEVRSVRSVAAARVELAAFRPQLLVADVVLPDGTAVDLLELAQGEQVLPAVVAVSGAAEPDASFRLAQLGVRAFLKKPIDLEALRAAIARALGEAPDIGPHLRNCVGQRPVREIEDQVRRTMVQEALARTEGSRRAAARLLSVSRQLLQHMLRGLESSGT
jgi:two-component system, response regulator RegA